MKKYCLILVLLAIPSECWAATYNAVIPKDLTSTTPTEGDTKPSEVNNSLREIKTVYLNQVKMTAISGTYTVSGTETVIIGSSTSPYLVSFPSASSVATGTITKEFVIKNRNTGTMTINLTIDGVGSPTVTGSQTMCIFTDGTSWFEKRVRTAALSSDSDTLDLLDSTYFTNATNLSTGTVNLNRIPGTLTGKSADFLDEQTGSYYTNASNLDSGTVPLLRIPATLTGKDADTIDGIDGTSIVKTTDNYVSSITAGTGISVDTNTGSVTITNSGVTQISAGSGVSVSNGGIGAVTVTAVGTSTAGGWLDTGTQTVATAGYPVVPQGTLTIHTDYGVSGLLDRDIPPDITLDNITQITTRNFANMQGTISFATQTSGTIGLGTQTSGTIGLGTQTSGTIGLGTQTSGRLPIAQMPLIISSVTKTDTQSTASTTYVDVTGLSINVTPVSAASIFLLIGNMSMSNTVGAGGAARWVFDANGTSVGIGDAAGSRNRSTNSIGTSDQSAGIHSSSSTFLHSPGTTTAQTYKIQFSTSGGTAYVNQTATDNNNSGFDRTISSLTVIELVN